MKIALPRSSMAGAGGRRMNPRLSAYGDEARLRGLETAPDTLDTARGQERRMLVPARTCHTGSHDAPRR